MRFIFSRRHFKYPEEKAGDTFGSHRDEEPQERDPKRANVRGPGGTSLSCARRSEGGFALGGTAPTKHVPSTAPPQPAPSFETTAE